MSQVNYHYDNTTGVFELYIGDTLIVELPYADDMTEEQAESLAGELLLQYLDARKEEQ